MQDNLSIPSTTLLSEDLRIESSENPESFIQIKLKTLSRNLTQNMQTYIKNNYQPLSASLVRSHMGRNIANIRKSTTAPRKARRTGSIRLAIFLIE
jgi:hypothetical protein